MLSVDFEDIFRKISGCKVAVVGDVMLDTYCWGNVERISPEAPVPVVSVKQREYRIGGAGNVALNLVALQAKTTLFSVLGDDSDGDVLIDLLNKQEIVTGYLVRSAHRLTTNKTRVMSRNQQMIRLDSEMTDDLLPAEADEMLQYFNHYVTAEQPDIAIFEDYNKGVLSSYVISRLIDICQQNGVITAVDPKRKNFFDYSGVTIFKPNLKEVFEGLNKIAENLDLPFLNEVHRLLHQKLNNNISLITLSEKGIFYQHDERSEWIASHVRNIADVSGAGDTVIAVASLVYAATKDMALAAAMANIAGGLVCEEVGTAPVNRQRLLAECRMLLQ